MWSKWRKTIDNVCVASHYYPLEKNRIVWIGSQDRASAPKLIQQRHYRLHLTPRTHALPVTQVRSMPQGALRARRARPGTCGKCVEVVTLGTSCARLHERCPLTMTICFGKPRPA